jgi:DNA-binding response OmpR family regulator
VKILIVEDEPEMAAVLSRGLEEEEFSVQVCGTGIAALDQAAENSFDLILLDAMLPGLDGFEVVSRLRERSETPVLMLTARDALSDVVRGLDNGADDYLTKPFSFRELLSRIRAIERRNGRKPRNVIVVGDLVLDVAAQRVFRRGTAIPVTLTEFRLLEVLARHQGRVLSRKQIIADVWGDRRDVEDNTLDVFVRLLRKKVDNDASSRLIVTHRGTGYSMNAPTAQ